MLQGATPFNANNMRMRIESLGNKMRFRLNGDEVNTNVTSYDPNASLEDRPYELSVRVAVCVDGLLEVELPAVLAGLEAGGADTAVLG